MVQQHGLTWGALDFVSPVPTEDGYVLSAIGGDTMFGNPQAEIQIVRSLLTDGSLAVLEGWDNREVPIRIKVSAPLANAGPALAAAEAAIMAEIQAPSKAPLIYVPPATDAATSVFDVVAATLERDYARDAADWDLEEEMREYRYFLLTLTCLPFARPEETVVVPALAPNPPVPTTVNIDTCDSTTNWSATYWGGPFTNAFGVVSGAVRVTQTPTAPSTTYPRMGLRRTGTLSTSGLPYLAIDVRTSHPAVYASLQFQPFNQPVIAPVATEPLSGGAVRYYFAGNITDFQVWSTTSGAASGPESVDPRWMEVSNIARTDTIPGSGTLRQQSRSAAVGGSAPTQAAIRLFDATPAALGSEILVHTSRNTAWQPPLRKWRASGSAVTADAARVSGARNTLATPTVFRMPASSFTEGTYSLMALMSISTSAVLGWSARMVSSTGAATVGSSVTVSGSITVPVTSGYQILNLAAIPLPVVKAEADQMVELTLTGTANMTLDEGWLCGLHDGVLTWIRDTDSLSWIEIRSPELGAARPSIYGGTGAKGANSIDVSWKAAGSTYGSFGTHRFEPGLMQIFTVTSTSLVSQSEIEFYPRYHSHVEGSAA